jgi:hypothetical protein
VKSYGSAAGGGAPKKSLALPYHEMEIKEIPAIGRRPHGRPYLSERSEPAGQCYVRRSRMALATASLLEWTCSFS